MSKTICFFDSVKYGSGQITIGKELLEMLSSENSIDVKRESINNFRRIMEVSFEHPMMREVYMRKKDDYILMRDMEHMLME